MKKRGTAVNDFRQRCEAIAERFLQTAVILDDQACIDDSFRPPVPLKKPDRHTLAQPPEEMARSEAVARHSLDARLLVDSFSERGLICAVVAPRPGSASATTVALAARRADIVILDWQIDDDNGKRALSILGAILQGDAEGRLRLIAIYTGEQDISGIGRIIAQNLKEHGWEFALNDRGLVLSLGHCRIVIYAKFGTSLTPDLKDRSISEIDVPKCLISDFADMTMGLLPIVALTSLSAVRENAHKILGRFHAKLDAAFLTHRACLSAPGDSQQHIVGQIADELRAMMDDATASTNPTGIEAIREWLEASAGPNADFIFGEGKKLCFEQTVDLLNLGLAKKPGPLSKNKDYNIITAGFDRTGSPKNELDLQFAWMINFRTVFNAPPPILHLGTVLRKPDEANPAAFFLCMRPRCDSVRLQGEEQFLLLPLIDPCEKTIQLVIKTSASKYQRVSVCTDSSRWSLVRFSPKKMDGPVVAEQDSTSAFFFTAADHTQFIWIGELKAEFAQRIAHRFASGLSRVAIDNSEWLRRWEGLND